MMLLNVQIEGTPLVVGLPLAVLGGLLSFVSPCVLPLVPGYIGYLAGTAVTERTTAPRRTLLLNGLAFVLGFSAVFTLVGVAVGQLLTSVQSAQGYVRWVGGVVVILLGFHMLGLLRLPLLHRTMKMQPHAATLPRRSTRRGLVALRRPDPDGHLRRRRRATGERGHPAFRVLARPRPPVPRRRPPLRAGDGRLTPGEPLLRRDLAGERPLPHCHRCATAHRHDGPPRPVRPGDQPPRRLVTSAVVSCALVGVACGTAI
jgi:hypothetical protein